jgi:flagellar biosynthetic protein FliP
MRVKSISAAALLMLAAGAALAQQQGGSLPLVVGQGAGGTSYSVPIQTLLFFTALSFLPAVLLLMTGFTRIVIVLSLLRQALGTQAAPPNQVIVGLSLFLTFFVMQGTFDKIYEKAYAPYAAGQMAVDQALKEGVVPLREFMLKQTRQSDVQLFSKLAKLPEPAKGESLASSVPLTVLVPAFVTSELKSAFQIGFMIFIPFLIIDMIVASVLMSLGMMMLSPVLVALPFKLMLFVLADGWNLLLGSLAASFVT